MNRIISFRISLIIIACSFFQSCHKEKNGLPVDGDGNTYDTIVIGNQTWLKQDLKTTKYNNEVSIPLVTDDNQWASMSSAAFCWYQNDPEFKDDYGALYNWWAVNVSFLCPVGYHAPNDEEWNILINYLGGEEIAGGKLKVIGTQFWYPVNPATNESGFTAMPGGWRSHDDGSFNSMRYDGYWWSLSPGISENYGSRLNMNHSLINTRLTCWFKKSGFSVRCIKD
jgi:uncharacterized protein (TIGR02145 family)